MKKAILVASFGSTYEQAIKNSIEQLENSIRNTFTEYDVFRVFTSERIVTSLYKRGIHTYTLEAALKELITAGFDDVIVQPSLIIEGIEYDKIRTVADRYKAYFSCLKIGTPLLYSQSDVERICSLFANKFRDKSDAIILMGHGTEHKANHIYNDFAEICTRLGYKHIFIVTACGALDASSVVPKLKEINCKDIILAPLLFVAGAHASNDMVSDKPDSIKSVLEAAGFSVKAVMKGLGEYEEVRQMYSEHLHKTIVDNTLI